MLPNGFNVCDSWTKCSSKVLYSNPYFPFFLESENGPQGIITVIFFPIFTEPPFNIISDHYVCKCSE